MSAQPTDGTTPRPWYEDDARPDGVHDPSRRVIRGPVRVNAMTDVVALPTKGADAALIVAAVNDYDRLLAVEAASLKLANEAARAVTEPRRFYENEFLRQQALSKAVAELRAALARPAEEERR